MEAVTNQIQHRHAIQFPLRKFYEYYLALQWGKVVYSHNSAGAYSFVPWQASILRFDFENGYLLTSLTKNPATHLIKLEG